ncbi:MAG: DNA-binding protein [Pseudomonadota bacterium]|nr:DNA-binding protein [Pseudomonadota bacterium]
MEYIFTLKYRLADDADADELVERLGSEGCNDALIGLGMPGRLALEFSREANSAREAIVSALADVKRAVPCAKLIEACPDFVGLSDVAAAVGMSRQNMRKLMVSSHNFPSPVHEGSAVVWHLADVLTWLDAKGAHQIEKSLLEVSSTAMQLNFAKETRQQGAMIAQDIWALTG